MERYLNNGKEYEVKEVTGLGCFINVNGTTITDQSACADVMGNDLGLYTPGVYTVFVDGDEIGFDSFEKAYDFAVNEQKGTFSI